MLDNYLDDLIASQSLAHIYRLPDEASRFSLAGVLAHTEEWVLLVIFDREGNYDGLRYLRKQAILRIKERSGYISSRCVAASLVRRDELMFAGGAKNLQMILERCRSHAPIANIVTNDLIITGRVDKVTEDWMCFEELDMEVAQFNGPLWIRQEDIVYVEVDTPQLRQFLRLVTV